MIVFGDGGDKGGDSTTTRISLDGIELTVSRAQMACAFKELGASSSMIDEIASGESFVSAVLSLGMMLRSSALTAGVESSLRALRILGFDEDAVTTLQQTIEESVRRVEANESITTEGFVELTSKATAAAEDWMDGDWGPAVKRIELLPVAAILVLRRVAGMAEASMRADEYAAWRADVGQAMAELADDLGLVCVVSAAQKHSGLVGN